MECESLVTFGNYLRFVSEHNHITIPTAARKATLPSQPDRYTNSHQVNKPTAVTHCQVALEASTIGVLGL